MQNTNELGQPVGISVPDWLGASVPDRTSLLGSRCRLDALDAERHAEALHIAYSQNRDGGNWTYLPYGPFSSPKEYREWVEGVQDADDPYFFAIVDSASETPVGVASYLRVVRLMGSIEVGHLSFSPALQRTPVSTEAMFLMMKRVFDDWGYRRYEWKCDSLNGPSVTAAKRLGFRYEGVFRNHVVMKGRNRDTAWFSMTDEEWPAIRVAMESWLDPRNFDEAGRQRKRLGSLMPETAGRAIVVNANEDEGSNETRSRRGSA
jgi:RimJ/RimL family protein N-acetyltransferase